MLAREIQKEINSKGFYPVKVDSLEFPAEKILNKLKNAVLIDDYIVNQRLYEHIKEKFKEAISNKILEANEIKELIEECINNFSSEDI